MPAIFYLRRFRRDIEISRSLFWEPFFNLEKPHSAAHQSKLNREKLKM
jgi:hypothetical protein